MLGRTHMSIGAAASVAIAPLVLHTEWEPLRQLVTFNWNVLPHVILAQAVLVVAAVIGSAIVDLDEYHSIAAQKVERLAGLPVLFILVALVLLLHLQTSIMAWGSILILALVLHTKKNVVRKIGLGIIGSALLYAGFMNALPLIGAIALVVWLIGAMVSKHRTFTHSLVGLMIFAMGIILTIQGRMIIWLHVHHFDPMVLVIPFGLIMGYIFHLLADIPTGGVPLFWPWGKRFGGHFIKTGGGWDHAIGGAAFVIFLTLAIL